MHLCVVSGTFHPEPGGPPTFLYRLLPELIKRGHTIHVITYGERDAPTNYPYTITRISRQQPIPLRLVQMVFTIVREAQNADAIFVSDYGLPVVFANFFLHKRIVVRLVADFAWEFAQRHAWIPETQTVEQFQTVPHSWKTQLLRFAQQTYLRLTWRVVVPSEHVAKMVKGWGISPLLIYNAVAIPIDALSSPPLSIPNFSHPCLITVARLTPVKGVDVVLQAFAYLRSFYPTAKLLIVGAGPAQPALQVLASKLDLTSSVHFVGLVEAEHVIIYLRLADVFVLGSRTEGLPHVVLEALSAGLPIVATRVGGTPEVVIHESNGLLVPPDQPELLGLALKRMLDHPELAIRFKQAAQVTLLKFSWETLVENYLHLLESAK